MLAWQEVGEGNISPAKVSRSPPLVWPRALEERLARYLHALFHRMISSTAGAGAGAAGGGSQAELIPLLLHTVWGLSKDMCASGLRVGVLHTRNHAVLKVRAWGGD